MSSEPIPDDIAAMTAQPHRMLVDGRAYMLHPLKLNDFGRLQVWVDAQFPDPIGLVNDAIKAGSYTVGQQQFLYRSAIEIAARGHRPIGTPEADDMVRSVHGSKQLLLMSIAIGDPTFTEADAEELYGKLTIGDLARVFAATEAEKILSDPKA
jgi:hypothetical protein